MSDEFALRVADLIWMPVARTATDTGINGKPCAQCLRVIFASSEFRGFLFSRIEDAITQ